MQSVLRQLEIVSTCHPDAVFQRRKMKVGQQLKNFIVAEESFAGRYPCAFAGKQRLAAGERGF